MQFAPINSPSTSKETRKIQSASSLGSARSSCSLPMVSAKNTNELPSTLSSNQDVNAFVTAPSPENTQIASSSHVESMSDTDEPQKSNTETSLQSLNVRPITNINNETLIDKTSEEWILKSLLASIFEDNFENYEQVLFKAYKENNPLKEKYLALTTLGFQLVKGCQQIKTRIAKLTLLELTEKHKNYSTQNVSQLKVFFNQNLANLLMNFFNYYKLMEELQPQRVQITTRISFNEMKKNHNEIVIKIQEIKKQLINSKRKYNFALNKKQITKTQVTQELPWYLTEQKALKMFKERFIGLSENKIKEIIFSKQPFQQSEDNTSTENITKALQKTIESDEALKLEFLLSNIFTIPFYYDEQVLFKVYKEDHPLKDKYLKLMMISLNAHRACLQIKSRIAQLEHLKITQSENSTQEENRDARSIKIVKTILCRDLTELLANSSSYYQLMEELKPSEIRIEKKIFPHKMKQIDTTPIDQIRTLKIKNRLTQKYYNTVLNEKKTTESKIIHNILHHLIEKEVINTIQEKFTTLSENKIKEIITSTKITPQIEDNKNTEDAADLLLNRSELEETLILESMLANIFNTSFYYYDEQNLFNAYINNNESKEDFLALMFSAMQAKEACTKIKTRIIQLLHFEQIKDSRECNISAVKNFLYRDLTELFTNSSNYDRLMDKLNQPRIQALPPQNMTPRQMRMLDEGIAELIRRKKKQFRATESYFNSINRDRPVKENQIIQSMLVYLTEQKAINGFKKKFTSLTEDKIKEIITRSVLQIAQNQLNKTIETSSDMQLSQKMHGDNLHSPAKKRRTQKSLLNASLSKALPESTTSQSSAQASVLSFSPSQSQALAVSESKQSTEVHFPSQSLELTPTQEEMEFAKVSEINTVSPGIPLSVLFFELFEQEGIIEDLDVPLFQSTEFENE